MTDDNPPSARIYTILDNVQKPGQGMTDDVLSHELQKEEGIEMPSLFILPKPNTIHD